jgi:hypothetical protein
MARATFDPKTGEYTFQGKLPAQVPLDVANAKAFSSFAVTSEMAVLLALALINVFPILAFTDRSYMNQRVNKSQRSFRGSISHALMTTDASMTLLSFQREHYFVTRYVNISSLIANHKVKRPDLLQGLFHFLSEQVNKKYIQGPTSSMSSKSFVSIRMIFLPNSFSICSICNHVFLS